MSLVETMTLSPWRSLKQVGIIPLCWLCLMRSSFETIDVWLTFNNLLSQEQKTCFVPFASFCSVSTVTMADFRLPPWHHWAWSWEEISTTGFWESIEAGCSTSLQVWRLTQRISHIPSISAHALLNWMALCGHVSVSLFSLFFSCPANKLA